MRIRPKSLINYKCDRGLIFRKTYSVIYRSITLYNIHYIITLYTTTPTPTHYESHQQRLSGRLCGPLGCHHALTVWPNKTLKFLDSLDFLIK